MDELNLDKYLNIVNKEKIEKGLDTYIPLYPMLRFQDNNLYIGVMLTAEDNNVWDIQGNVKPEYWILIDMHKEEIVSFNKTDDNDFIIGSIIPKDKNNKQKEILKYTVEKTLQYENYLIDDIKNEQLPLQKKLSSILGSEMEINGEKVNINDYLLSNLEEDIKKKIKDLVDVLIWSKYSSITFYYDNLFNQVVKNYRQSGQIDKDKMKLCAEIMDNYYDGVIYISNFFNILNI